MCPDTIFLAGDSESLKEAKRVLGQTYDCGFQDFFQFLKDFEIYTKQDESPLTEADQAANAIILKGLLESYPDIPYISEEVKQDSYNERKNWN